METVFGFIIHPMESGLAWIAVSVGSAGLGIILFTALVRLILSPLQITQLRNARSMQRIQPYLLELRQKHGKDRQKMAEATSALYKEHRVNPLMGCFPTALQFPVLLGLYYALIHLGLSPQGYPNAVTFAGTVCHGVAIHSWGPWFDACYAISGTWANAAHVWALFHAHFLWLNQGLGEPDPLHVLPALAGLTQWVQSRMMLTKTSDPQQKTMNRLMNFMPLMIVFFAWHNSSGLSLYWVTSALIGIAFQYKITGLGLLPDALHSGRAYLSLTSAGRRR